MRVGDLEGIVWTTPRQVTTVVNNLRRGCRRPRCARRIGGRTSDSAPHPASPPLATMAVLPEAKPSARRPSSRCMTSSRSMARRARSMVPRSSCMRDACMRSWARTARENPRFSRSPRATWWPIQARCASPVRGCHRPHHEKHCVEGWAWCTSTSCSSPRSPAWRIWRSERSLPAMAFSIFVRSPRRCRRFSRALGLVLRLDVPTELLSVGRTAASRDCTGARPRCEGRHPRRTYGAARTFRSALGAPAGAKACRRRIGGGARHASSRRGCGACR